MSDLRLNNAETSEVYDSEAQLSLNFVSNEAMVDHQPLLQLSYGEGQSIYDKVPFFQMSYAEFQSIHSLEISPWADADTEGSEMSTAIFPELKGLTFDIKRRPLFSNVVQDHISGRETRLAFWDKPKWEFELSYDYLPNRPKSVGNTDLESILGFFLLRKGNFQSFLFKFQDDWKVEGGYIGVGNGSNIGYNFVRSIGGYVSEVDFVNFTTSAPVIYWDRASEPYIIPVTPGPYTIMGSPDIKSIAEVKVGSTVLTQVAGAPTVNQYQVDLVTGVFTFNAARQGQTVTISYRHLVTNYETAVPNTLTFLTVPPANVTIYADFEYYFNVRFLESEAEFNLFYESLYELEEITLRSVPV